MIEKLACLWPEIAILSGACICMLLGLSSNASVRRVTVCDHSNRSKRSREHRRRQGRCRLFSAQIRRLHVGPNHWPDWSGRPIGYELDETLV